MKIVTISLVLLLVAGVMPAAMTSAALTPTEAKRIAVILEGVEENKTQSVTSGAWTKDGIKTSVVNNVRQFLTGIITRDELRQRIIREYTSGILSREELKIILTKAYAQGKLKRDDIRSLLIDMYKAGELRRDDVKWFIIQGYKRGELTRDDLRELITQSYKNGELTRDDVKWILIQSFKAGDLHRDDVREVIAKAYKAGELRRDDVKWFIIQGYKRGELTRDDLREILTKAYVRGELKPEDLKWLLTQAHREGVLNRAELREILTKAYNRGELARGDIAWFLIQAYKSGELTKEDVVELLIAAYKNGELTRADVEWIVKEAQEKGEFEDADVLKRMMETKVVKKPPAIRINLGKPVFVDADTTKVMVLHKFAFPSLERHRIGMEVIIGYVDEIGGDSSSLVELKAEFVARMVDLKLAVENGERAEVHRILDELREIVKRFRAEARAQIGEENLDEARARLDAALVENEEYFNSLQQDAREIRKERMIEVFDISVARAEDRISELAEKGIGVDELIAKLNEIKEKRSDFIATANKAIETGDRTEYDAMRADIKKEFGELREMFSEKLLAAKLADALETAKEMVDAISIRLDELEAEGIDVTVERAKLDEVMAILESAESKYNDGDYEAAKEKMAWARNTFTKVIRDFKKGKKVFIHGTGRLEAEGNGFAFIRGSVDFVDIAGKGNLVVRDNNGDMTIEVSGFGTKRELGEGEYRYAGEGSARIHGSNVEVSLRGIGIKLAAEGTGSVTLRGNGSYSAGDKQGSWPVISMELEKAGGASQ
jgi:hypothetical protein